MSDNIHVAIRIRPLIKREVENNANILWKTKGSTTIYQANSPTTEYCFDRVFNVDNENFQIYQELCEPIVHSVMEGFNGTIFAYGQTSSGKTYTMMGEYGIIPSAIHDIFNTINNMPEREFLLRVSYLEIYKENVLDLLSNESKNLKTLEDMDGLISIMGLVEEEIKTTDEVFRIMKKGEKKRRVGDTQMNEKSSRSHAIFRMIVESRMRNNDEDSVVNVGQLNLVDLAGSERSGQMGISGERLKEGTYINKSLLMLTQVISQLSKGDKQQHVSYRDSKLTRILQNSLGGNARTVIICTVTPATIQETLSTLNFASRAKRIKNKPTANIVSNDKALLKRYTKEIRKLSEKLETLQQQGDCGKELLEKELEEKNKQNKNLKKQIQELKEKFVVSQISPDYANPLINKKNRRETWCGLVNNQDFKMELPFPKLNKSPLNSSILSDIFGAEKQDRISPLISPPDYFSPTEGIDVSIQTDEYFFPANEMFFQDFHESSPNTSTVLGDRGEVKDLMNVSIQVSITQSLNTSVQTDFDAHNKSVQVEPAIGSTCQTEIFAEDFGHNIPLSCTSVVVEDIKQMNGDLDRALTTQSSFSEVLHSLSDHLTNINLTLLDTHDDNKTKALIESFQQHFSAKYEGKIKYLEAKVELVANENENLTKEVQSLESSSNEKNKELETILDSLTVVKKELCKKNDELADWQKNASQKYDLYLESMKKEKDFQNLLKDLQSSVKSKEKCIKNLTEKTSHNEIELSQLKEELLENVKLLTLARGELVSEKANMEKIKLLDAQEKDKLNAQIHSLTSQLEMQAEEYKEIIEEIKKNYAERCTSAENRLKKFYEEKLSTLEKDKNECYNQKLADETEKLHVQLLVQINNINAEKVKLEKELFEAKETLKKREGECAKNNEPLNVKEDSEELKKSQAMAEKLQKKLEVSEKIILDLNKARKTDLESVQEKERKKALLENVIKEKDHILKQYTSKFNTFKSKVEEEYKKLKAENEKMKEMLNGGKTKDVELNLIEKKLEINELQQRCKKLKEENSVLLQKLSLCKNEIRRLHDQNNESKVGKENGSESTNTTTSNVQLQAALHQKERYVMRLEKEIKKYQDYLKSKGHHKIVEGTLTNPNVKENKTPDMYSPSISNSTEKSITETITPYNSAVASATSNPKPLADLQYDSQNCRQQ